MRTKMTVLALLLGLLFLSRPAPVAAHVLIPDKSGTVGAIVHFAPNDNPAAQAATGVFYNVQTKTNLADASINLIIESADGGIRETVPMEVEDGQSVLGSFIFPVRGLYYLTLEIGPKADAPEVPSLVFESTLRITHSEKGTDPKVPAPAWAIFGLILTAWVAVALIMIAIKRRKLIIGQSR